MVSVGNITGRVALAGYYLNLSILIFRTDHQISGRVDAIRGSLDWWISTHVTHSNGGPELGKVSTIFIQIEVVIQNYSNRS